METRSLPANAITLVRSGTRLKTAGNMRLIKKRDQEWKKTKEKEVGASNIEILLGCTETSAIKYENSKVLFEIEQWELVLQKLEEIPIPSNPPDDNGNGMGNINMEENKKDGLDGENSTGRSECCLSRIKKLTILARVALLH